MALAFLTEPTRLWKALPISCPRQQAFCWRKKLSFIGGAVDNPQHPFVAIIGGAKVSDKIGVIANLLTKADTILNGGGMANTFLGRARLQAGQVPGRSR
jgi:3-phosphoglycerate kinase